MIESTGAGAWAEARADAQTLSTLTTSRTDRTTKISGLRGAWETAGASDLGCYRRHFLVIVTPQQREVKRCTTLQSCYGSGNDPTVAILATVDRNARQIVEAQLFDLPSSDSSPDEAESAASGIDDDAASRRAAEPPERTGRHPDTYHQACGPFPRGEPFRVARKPKWHSEAKQSASQEE